MSTNQHDTLDQIISQALQASFEVVSELKCGPDFVAIHVAAVQDALLAEGETYWRTVPQPENSFMAYRYQLGRREGDGYERVLVIPLLVGVGCGNAKKDTP